MGADKPPQRATIEAKKTVWTYMWHCGYKCHINKIEKNRDQSALYMAMTWIMILAAIICPDSLCLHTEISAKTKGPDGLPEPGNHDAHI